MHSQSIHSSEFVCTEAKTSRTLFEILLLGCHNCILKITAEEVSNLNLYTYVLSSIYLLYLFQRVIIRHPHIFYSQYFTVTAINLSSNNHAAIYLHCVWDNLLRYLFNTLLGLLYRSSFFYPTPQHFLKVFLCISVYHPTSERLDF